MFEDIVVVQSAVSAFNNAALVAPAFLWWAILALPLFIVSWLCGRDIVGRIGWQTDNLLVRVSVWTAGLTFLWVVLFGGNYAVLRDELSVLPMMNAVLVFLAALFVSSYVSWRALPGKKWARWMGLTFIIAAVGLSDAHVWWGPILQIGAFLLGVALGQGSRMEMRPISGVALILLMTVCAILMQPEFYRFGQLGNLTVAHLLAVLIVGIFAVLTVIVANVRACGKVSRGIFIKLKWLMRVLCLLGAALFVLTEALPVFLGTLGAIAILAILSVWHAGEIDARLADKLFAGMLVGFGVITVMPAVTVLGILYWVNTPRVDFLREFRRLL